MNEHNKLLLNEIMYCNLKKTRQILYFKTQMQIHETIKAEAKNIMILPIKL